MQTERQRHRPEPVAPSRGGLFGLCSADCSTVTASACGSTCERPTKAPLRDEAVLVEDGLQDPREGPPPHRATLGV